MAKIEIFTLIGKMVSVPLSQQLVQGLQTIAWDGTGINGEKLLPGIYLYRLTVNDRTTTGKISIIR